MDAFVMMCFLFFAILVGINQEHHSSMKVDAFSNFVNSNTQQEPPTNQQSKPIVNVSF